MPLELARTAELTRNALERRLRNHEVADDGRRDHVRIVTGPQPYRHAHYAAAEFFQFDADAGAVRNIYGQRVLRVTGNFFRALVSSLAGQSAAGAERVLEAIGRAWGAASMKEFAPRIEQEYEVDFEKMHMSVMLESWWWSLRAAGWGTWRCDFSHAPAGLVLVDVSGSALAEARAPLGTVACPLYAGLFAAAFGHLARRDLGAVELRCAAKGDPHCQFLVAARPRVEQATARRDAGDSVEQIIGRLK